MQLCFCRTVQKQSYATFGPLPACGLPVERYTSLFFLCCATLWATRKEFEMTANSVVRARIDEQTKKRCRRRIEGNGPHRVRRLPPDDGQDRQGEGVAV
jgi:hypothetical protein